MTDKTKSDGIISGEIKTGKEKSEKTKSEKTKSEKIKLRKRLGLKISAIMIIAVFFLFSAMITIVISTVEKLVKESTYSMSKMITAGHASEFKNWIDIYVNDMKVYSEAEVNKTGNKEAVLKWFWDNRDIKNSEYSYVIFCDEDGTSYRDDGFVGEKGSLLDRDYYKAVLKEDVKIFVGKMVKSKTTDKYVLPVARAVKDAKGKTFGAFVGMLDINTITRRIAAEKIGDSGVFFIVDSNANIIAHNNPEYFMRNVGDSEEILALMKNNEDSECIIEKDGVKNHLFSSHVRMSDWTLIFSMEENEIIAPVIYTRRVTIIFGLIIGFMVLIIFIISLSKIFKKIKVINGLLNELSTGEADLTIQLPVKKDDEIDALVKAVNKFISKFRSIMITVKDSENKLKSAGESLTEEIISTTSTIGQMSESIKQVNGQVQNQSASVENSASAIAEITKNIESLDNMIQSQASSVVQASAAVEEMVGNINSVDNSVLKMSEEFTTLENDTKQGIEKNTSVNELIQKISDQSVSMVDANMIIKSIADQTNLLAMNAAIEAAHAGDAGRGFSVVADEIRKLAETSAEQSARIEDELAGIQEGISNVVTESAESEKSFQAVSSRIISTGQLISIIKSAMEEQQTGSQQILEALQLMNDSTSEVKGAAEEMNQGGELIMKDISELQMSMDEITNAILEITSGTDYVNKTTNKLKDISDSLSDSIDKVSKDVNLFKV